MNSQGPEFNPAMQADEPLTPFDVTQSSERVGLLKLAIGFGFLLLLAFAVLKIYHPDGTRDRDDPPLITAENTPFKVVPEDRGGMQTPDQDKEVFDIMAGNPPATDVVTMPPPETPVDRPDRNPQPAPEVTTPAVEPSAPTPAIRTPQPQPTVPETRPTPRPTPPAAQSGSEWIVQVASLRSEGEAQRTFDAIRSRNAAILGGYTSDIARVDLGDKGIYYRARVAGFADRDAANRVCSQLKTAGQSCFVARR
ncbi:MAG: SPOR domain-containing protein [Litorimonas sp.]